MVSTLLRSDWGEGRGWSCEGQPIRGQSLSAGMSHEFVYSSSPPSNSSHSASLVTMVSSSHVYQRRLKSRMDWSRLYSRFSQTEESSLEESNGVQRLGARGLRAVRNAAHHDVQVAVPMLLSRNEKTDEMGGSSALLTRSKSIWLSTNWNRSRLKLDLLLSKPCTVPSRLGLPVLKTLAQLLLISHHDRHLPSNLTITLQLPKRHHHRHLHLFCLPLLQHCLHRPLHLP
jgi:hypothetical protein